MGKRSGGAGRGGGGSGGTNVLPRMTGLQWRTKTIMAGLKERLQRIKDAKSTLRAADKKYGEALREFDRNRNDDGARNRMYEARDALGRAKGSIRDSNADYKKYFNNEGREMHESGGGSLLGFRNPNPNHRWPTRG